jgi:3-keto-disaccharide hydrolase
VARTCSLVLGLLVGFYTLATPSAHGQTPPGVWTDPADKTLPADFQLQGEYRGASNTGVPLGAQVIALGQGAFQAVVYPGGLPGAGWDGRQKILMDGKLDGDRAAFSPTTGRRRYLAPKPEEFSAVSSFPPPGQTDCTATIADGVLRGKMGDRAFELKKATRESPTLGRSPPVGAVVLFDGKTTSGFDRGRLDEQHGVLNTDGRDVSTTRKFGSYTLHVEFMLPYRPESRGQSRGNSGLYLANRYEVQILDSFGLDGKSNECGGVYTRLAPKVNMCLPPLRWQTFDIDFTNAAADDAGKKVSAARLTVRLNGVLIHDDVEIAGPTGGARGKDEGAADVLRLQGHRNFVQFRNLWLVEKK